MCKDSFSGTGGHFQLPDMLAEALVLCFLNIFGKKKKRNGPRSSIQWFLLGFFEAQYDWGL